MRIRLLAAAATLLALHCNVSLGGSFLVTPYRLGRSRELEKVPSSQMKMSTDVVVAPWVTSCGRLAPWASIGVSMAPLPTIRSIAQEGSVGDLPLLPYSSLISNAFVWTMYGVLKKESKVWSCNAVGVFLGLYYFRGFARYAPKSSPTFPGSIAQHVRACCAIVVLVTSICLLFPSKQAAPMLGTMGVTFCIALFASPLAALKVVLDTKSAKSIPWPFTLATVLNCFLWSVFGMLELHDVNIYLPNVLGLMFGLTQLGLKVRYGENDKRSLPV